MGPPDTHTELYGPTNYAKKFPGIRTAHHYAYVQIENLNGPTCAILWIAQQGRHDLSPRANLIANYIAHKCLKKSSFLMRKHAGLLNPATGPQTDLLCQK